MSPEPVVLLSALEHYMYCPRQCALIHVDGLWADNAHTVAGTRSHKRVDTAASRKERDRVVLRGVPLYSEVYGLSGRADAIEVGPDGLYVPVEYKSGVRHGQAAEIQLCAQALCLEEMRGQSVDHGYVWYARPRSKERVEIGQALREQTIQIIELVRKQVVDGVLPPAVWDQRCKECQLEPFCMPNVVFKPDEVLAYVKREVYGCD